MPSIHERTPSFSSSHSSSPIPSKTQQETPQQSSTEQQPQIHPDQPPTLADRLAVYPAPLPPQAFAGAGIHQDASSLYPPPERSRYREGNFSVPDTSDPRRSTNHKLSDQDSFRKLATAQQNASDTSDSESPTSPEDNVKRPPPSKILYPHHPKPVFGSDVPYTVIPPVQSSRTATESPLPSPAPLSWFDVYSTILSPAVYRLPPQIKQIVDFIPMDTYIYLTGLVSYLLGYLAWGWLYALAVCAGVGYYFSVGRERERKKMEFKHDRESGRKLLEKGDGETVEWLNHLVNQLWVTVDPVLLASICDMIEDTVTSVMPAIVKSCNVRDFEFGTMSPRITKMKIYPQEGLDSDVVYGIVQLAFHPSATPKFPASTRPAGTPTPPHFQLSLLLFSKTVTNIVVPVYVGFESFSGTVRFRLKLGSQPPFVKNLAFAFVGLPKIDVGVKLLDRSLPDIVKLPVFREVVFKQAIDMVFEAFTEPNVVPMNLEKILMGDGIEHDLYARGILRVHIFGASGLRRADVGSDNDPFVSLSLYPNRPLAKTRVLMDTAEPVWNETHYLIVSRDDPANHACLRALVQDWDRLKAADEIGYASLPISKFCPTDTNDDGVVEGQEQDDAKVVLDEKTSLKDRRGRKLSSNEVSGRGKLQWKVEWLPKLSFKAENELMNRGKKFYAGILGITIHQCQDLEIGDANLASRSPMEGINSYVRVYINCEPVYKTRLKIHNPNPYFNAQTERFIRDWRTAKVTAVVKDQRHHEFDPIVGVVTVSLSDVFTENNIRKETSRWWPLTDGIGYGKVRMSIVFRPIQLVLPECQRGYDVGTLVVDRLACHGILKDSKSAEISTFLDVDLNFPVPGSRTTPVAKKESNPSWPDSVFSLPVNRRYQATLVFRLKRRTGIRLRSRTIARAELPLAQLVDGVPTELTLTLVPRGDTLKTHSGHQRIHSNSSDKSIGELPAPLAVRTFAPNPLGETSADAEMGVDYDVPNTGLENTVSSSSDASDAMTGSNDTSTATAFSSSGSPTISFRAAFFPGIAAVQMTVAEDAEQAMELAAVDASAIADDISETGEDDDLGWGDASEGGGGGESNQTPPSKRKHKLPLHQKDFGVDPKTGEIEIRRSDYLATKSTQAKKMGESTGASAEELRERVSTQGSTMDSKGDLNLDPLSSNVTNSSSGRKNAAEEAAGGLLGQLNGTYENEGATDNQPAQTSSGVDVGGATGIAENGTGSSSTVKRSCSSASFSSSSSDHQRNDKDSIYFAQGTEPFPRVHRNLNRHRFVRTLKWGKDVIKNKISHAVKGGKSANADTGTVEQEEV